MSTVKRLLDEGVPASLPMPWSEDRWEGPVPPTDFPIHLAVSAGHIEIVRLLVDRGADAKAPGGEGDYTPLHQANDPEIAKLLISRGADVNARNASGDQPVHSATYPSHLENRRNEAVGKSLSLIQFLVQHGADPLAKDDSGTQPIHIAAGNSTAKVVSFLFEQNAKVDAVVRNKEDYFNNGWQPLHYAANRDDMAEALDVAERLIHKGAAVNATTAEGKTPLHFSKTAAMTRLLLEHGAKLDAMSTGSIKEQPIHQVATNGDVESLKLLLDRGADIAAICPDDERPTPLDAAAFWGKTDVVRFLLSRGAKPTERTMRNARRFDDNPLVILQLLHQHGGTISAEMFLKFPKDSEALVPLLDPKAKDELLKHSDQHIAEAASSPYHLEAEGSLGTIRALAALGAKIDAATGEGWQPVHFAAAFGDLAMLKAVISVGGNPAVKTRDGKTPLLLAEDFKQDENVKFLKDLKPPR